MSVLDRILDAVVARVGALGLAAGTDGPSVPVAKRKLPKREEAVDPATQITVCGRQRVDRVGWLAFGVKRVEYFVQVVVVSPNDGDQASNLGLYTEWREAIRDEFCAPPLGGVPEVWDMDVLDGDFLNRKELSEGYDYQEVPIKVTTAEPVAAPGGP